MDLILAQADELFFTRHEIYPKGWTEDNIVRQAISLFVITCIGGYVLYFGFAALNYKVLFDKNYTKHPKFLKDQVRKEITVAAESIPIMTLLTLPIFVAEVRGYSKLYDNLNEYHWAWTIGSVLLFMFFNDMLIYWIHRGLHHPSIYKHIHKTHHRWLVPTPFASHAFHPVDGFLQSTPYHIFVFLFPLHKVVYLTMFVLVNFWTISIHDGNYAVPKPLDRIINGAAHHTDHHLYYTFNYGQYFTLWDRIGKSYREPQQQSKVAKDS